MKYLLRCPIYLIVIDLIKPLNYNIKSRHIFNNFMIHAGVNSQTEDEVVVKSTVFVSLDEFSTLADDPFKDILLLISHNNKSIVTATIDRFESFFIRRSFIIVFIVY